MEIVKLEVTPIIQNCRIIIKDKFCVVIDPGGDFEKIKSLISGLIVEEVWITHSHFDHIGAVKKVKEYWPDAILKGSKTEKIFREKAQEAALSWGIEGIENCPEPDVYIDEDSSFYWQGVEVHAIFTPGHSPGHFSFYIPKVNSLISGDTIFKGSIGRTDLPGSNHSQLIKSIKDKIFQLDNSTKILPGHGPDTILEYEKRTNPFLVNL